MLKLIIFLTLFFGIVIIFDFKIKDFYNFFANKNKNYLKEKIKNVNNQKSKFFLINYLKEENEILKLLGKEELFPYFVSISFFLSFILSYICLILNNFFMIAPLILISFCLPFFVLKIIVNNYEKRITNHLESALSLITTSYLRNENIVLSIEENKEYFNMSIKGIFEEFLVEVNYLNENIIESLKHMKMKIKNSLFDEFVDNLILLQSDKSKKFILNNTLSKFSSIKLINLDLSLNLYEPVKEFMSMVILSLLNIPLIYFLNKDWYLILVNEPLGKFMIALSLLFILIGFINIPRIIKPLNINN